MLVPVSGIIQVGEQAHADRYMYLPQIGLYILVTWLVADTCILVASSARSSRHSNGLLNPPLDVSRLETNQLLA